MRIGEHHALLGKTIDVRRRDLRFRVEALRIAVAQVVGQEDHHVRQGRSHRARAGREEDCQSSVSDRVENSVHHKVQDCFT